MWRGTCAPACRRWPSSRSRWVPLCNSFFSNPHLISLLSSPPLPLFPFLPKATSLVPGRVKSSVGKSGRFVVSSGWDFGDGSMRRSIHFDDVDDPKGSPSVAPIVEGTATPAEGAGGDSGPAADAAPQGADGQQPGAMVVNLCLRMRGMNENQIQVISFEMHLPDG